MKNSDFFIILSSVRADCRLSDLPNSYFWNTRKMWNYYYRVCDAGDGDFYLNVFYSFNGDWTEIFTVILHVSNGFVCVSNISFPDYTPSSLIDSFSFHPGKYRNSSSFLDALSFAVKELDLNYFSCV